MFFYKTEFCPFNLTEHDMSKCVYAHNLQDYRRKPDHYSYQPIVHVCSFSLASIGRPRNISMIIIVDVNLERIAICVMDGKSSNIIHHIIRQSSARLQDVKKDVAPIIIRRNKRELLRRKLSTISSVMCLKIELLRECLRLIPINKGLSLNLSKRRIL